jgi:hypothetical protein
LKFAASAEDGLIGLGRIIAKRARRHGDDVLEIACSAEIPNAKLGSEIEMEFFR